MKEEKLTKVLEAVTTKLDKSFKAMIDVHIRMSDKLISALLPQLTPAMTWTNSMQYKIFDYCTNPNYSEEQKERYSRQHGQR